MRGINVWVSLQQGFAGSCHVVLHRRRVEADVILLRRPGGRYIRSHRAHGPMSHVGQTLRCQRAVNIHRDHLEERHSLSSSRA